jgi:hypothetical protein
MKRLSKMRTWATPITIGAFILTAVTGIMLFFKLNLGMAKVVHEWLSWLLVAGTIFHVIANWKFMTNYLGSHLGRGIIAVFIIITAACLIPFGDSQGGHPHNRTSEALVRSPLSSVAMVAGHKPGEAVSMLQANGIRIEGNDQSIAEIARVNGKAPVDILNIVF